MVFALMFEEFFKITFSFPTAIFTVFMGVMVVLWLFTVLGMLDLDIFDLDLDFDGDADVDLNMDNATAEAVAGFLISWGLIGVPITIMLTLLSIVAWIICYYTVFFLFDFVPSGPLSFLAGTGTVIGSFFIAVKVTAALIKPLRPLFKKVGKTVEKTVLGQVAVIRSSKVTSSFGEAMMNDMGADLLLRIWADEPNELKKGDRVVPIEYDRNKGTYQVVPENKFKN